MAHLSHDLLFARLQMAWSLGFHIIFAVVGIGMPALMAIAEYRWLRTGNQAARELTRHWAKGTAIFFAVGAVSGTVLSFELGLLWPGFMKHAGGIIGFPFSMEGFAFFTEAIFLGIYLYGWDRIRPWAHWWAGVAVALSGMASAVFVVMANAWMNTPAGFDFDPSTGQFSNIDPIAAMFNPAWKAQALHMVIAAYLATAFAVAGIHAWGLLKQPASRFHREALQIAMTVGAVTAVLQPISGDYAARVVAETQPVKLAAMEGQFETVRGAPIRIGGWPDEDARTTRYGLEIPAALSFLAYGDFDAEVRGLNEFPTEDWPPVAIVHVSFQAMVLLGLLMLVAGVWYLLAAWREKKVPLKRSLLGAIVATSPAGILAVEAGWMVTEVGRQPWIIQGVMRTREAVTPMPGLVVPFITFLVVYLGLAAIVVAIFVRQVRAAPPLLAGDKAGRPSGAAHAG
jgi:cytochrome d ubiquinol oxidase subunit I